MEQDLRYKIAATSLLYILCGVPVSYVYEAIPELMKIALVAGYCCSLIALVIWSLHFIWSE